MRADVCSSIQGTKSKDEKDRGGHCKKWRWTPQNACLGIVAVDTAKTLKMEWEGWEGWESRVWVVAVDTAKRMKMHAINNNQVFMGTSLQSFRLKIASSLTSSCLKIASSLRIASSSFGPSLPTPSHLMHARNGTGTHLAVDTAAKGIWRLTPLLHTRRLKPRAIT